MCKLSYDKIFSMADGKTLCLAMIHGILTFKSIIGYIRQYYWIYNNYS